VSTSGDPGHGGGGTAVRANGIREAYVGLFGQVPLSIEHRIELAELTGRLDAVEVIEALRRALVTENPLGAKQQQLVHFGQLVALGHRELALLHARAARRAGATPAELVGVVETALITAGMPAYSQGVSTLTELFRQDELKGAPDDRQ